MNLMFLIKGKNLVVSKILEGITGTPITDISEDILNRDFRPEELSNKREL